MVPLFIIGLSLAASSGSAERLLPPPLCEPSALLAVGGALLAGDNEREALYALDAEGQVLRALPLPDAPHDVEALAAWGDHLVVVGSHSRGSARKGCEIKARRLAILVARLGKAGLEGGRLISVDGVLDGGLDKRVRQGLAQLRADSLASPGACLRGWFDGAPAGAAEVCQAMVAAEGSAAFDAAACARTLNIEGAVVLAGRLWLGLRAPVVGGHAVLLRVAGTRPDALDALRFDAVARLDLGGMGVRELTVVGDGLAGIAGPEADGPGFRLFRLPASAVVPGASAAPTAWAAAPDDTEGLAPGPGGLRYVVDGAQDPDDSSRCRAPGRLGVLPLPEVP
ncbi:MAG: DUF3616 domain-containing protein [bacterium]